MTERASNDPGVVPAQRRILVCYAGGCQPDTRVATQLFSALAPDFSVRMAECFAEDETLERIQDVLGSVDVAIVLLSTLSVTHSVVALTINAWAAPPDPDETRAWPLLVPIRLAYTEPFPVALAPILDSVHTLAWSSDRDTPSLIGQIKRYLASAVSATGDTGAISVSEHPVLFASETTIHPDQPIAIAGTSRVVTALTLACDFAEFDPDSIPALFDQLSRLVHVPLAGLRLMGFECGSVVVLVEMDEHGAKQLFECYLRRDAALRQLGIKRVEFRLPEDGSAATDPTNADPVQILFLAANPRCTQPLQLDREAKYIQDALRCAALRDRFALHQEWAVRTADLRRCLLQYKPDIVHFSGHGTRAGELLFDDGEAFSQAQPMPPESLARLFHILNQDVRLVLLNACFSAVQAEAIAQHVDCVLGMSGEIAEESSLAFSGAFYETLGFGRDVQTAFDLGCHAVANGNRSQQIVPRLLSRDGIDPSGLVFA